MRLDVIGIGLIGVGSGVLYAVIYWTQQAIFLNGWVLETGAIHSGYPADVPRLLVQFGIYCIATIALFALYGGLLVLCRQGELRDRKTRLIALLFPLLFNLGLWFGQPYLSIDLFNYMAYGHLGDFLGGNPYAHAARDAIHTALGQRLVGYGWRPVHDLSPYGPVWTQVELTIMGMTQQIPVAMLWFKAVIIAASLGSAALIWAILRVVRPADQVFGTLAYLWNPMLIIEFAGEGHNDALMLLFMLAALAACVYAYPALAILLMMLAALTKYLPVIFFPPLLVYLWHTRRSDRHFFLNLLLGLGCGLGLGYALYGTPAAALAALQGLQMQTQPRFSVLPSGLLFGLLASMPLFPEVTQLMSNIWKGLVSIAIVILSRRIRDLTSLVRAALGLSLVLLVGSPVYWSWYVCLPLSLSILVPYSRFFQVSLVLAFCSRLVAPLAVLANNNFIPWWFADEAKNAIGVMLPLITLLLFYRRQSQRRSVS